jgi:hypothetical protein
LIKPISPSKEIEEETATNGANGSVLFSIAAANSSAAPWKTTAAPAGVDVSQTSPNEASSASRSSVPTLPSALTSATSACDISPTFRPKTASK